MTSDQPTTSAGIPPQVRVAGGLVALQGLAAVAFAVVLGVSAERSDLDLKALLAETGYFLIIGACLLAVGIGLLAGRRWARTPAIVAQLLLLPVVYSLIGPSRQLLLGIASGVLVGTTFMLLISEASRAWSMGLHLDGPTNRNS